MTKKYSSEWYHNKGQSDFRPEGGYDSPLNGPIGFLTSSKEDNQANIDASEAYDKGWNNARDQYIAECRKKGIVP